MVYQNGIPSSMTMIGAPAELPLRASVRDRIRLRIVDGTLSPGTRLVERNLAAELGVSRVPVREALRDLVAEGYAVDRVTRGIAVRDYPAAEIEELFEIRAALEAVLLRRALDGLPAGGEAALRVCLAQTQSALDVGDLAAAVAANARFHEVLADVAAGPMLSEMLLGIRDRMRWLLRQHGNPADIHAEHVELLNAIVRGDRGRAEELSQQHLSTSRRAQARPHRGHQVRRRTLVPMLSILLLTGCTSASTSAVPTAGAPTTSEAAATSTASTPSATNRVCNHVVGNHRSAATIPTAPTTSAVPLPTPVPPPPRRSHPCRPAIRRWISR